MAATLPLARAEFITQLRLDTQRPERARLVAVLDAFIAWSGEHADLVRFRADDNSKGSISFEQVGSNIVIWSATPRRDESPRLQLLPGAQRLLTDSERADMVKSLGTWTREELKPDGMIQIGFGALKNRDACTAVLQMMSDLMAKPAIARRAVTRQAGTPREVGVPAAG